MSGSLDLHLAGALTRLGKLQGLPIDQERMIWSLRQHRGMAAAPALVDALCRDQKLVLTAVLDTPDPARLPALCRHRKLGFGVLTGRSEHGLWLFEQQAGKRRKPLKHTIESSELDFIGTLAAVQRAKLANDGSGKVFTRLLRGALWSRKGILLDAALATLFINTLNLAASFYSMQIYDRVIPTQTLETLQVLTIGLTLGVLIEVLMKWARSALMERMSAGLDAQLSREVFERLTSIRLDQFPTQVGSLASQVKGYEQVRSLFSATSLFAMVDLPFAAVFIAVMISLAGPMIGVVPLAAAVLAVTLGLIARHRVNQLAQLNAAATHRKAGLLVETVEGAETWKSAHGGWKFLSRWLDVSEQGISQELKTRQTSESLNFILGALHQLAYAGVVATGAYLAVKGQITMGAVIACSILAGRVLGPLAALPNLLVQSAHARAGLEGIEKLYQLAQDNEGVERPLAPSQLRGGFELKDISFAYQRGTPALQINRQIINPGDKIGVIGPIGSGKSTLIKLLTGMYAPNQGQILVDGLDIGHVSRQVLARQIAYLAQDHRMFEGTLRDNLLIGLADPPDDVLHRVLEQTGLSRLVAAHPKGLELPIHEGGRGLSGGQKQLVALTRLLLAEPQVYLLDEPTASMDSLQEAQALHVLKQTLAANPERTMVVVTHKPALLPLVDKLWVIVDHKIVMAGPRDEVMRKMQMAMPVMVTPEPAAAVAASGVKAEVTTLAAAALKDVPRKPVRPEPVEGHVQDHQGLRQAQPERIHSAQSERTPIALSAAHVAAPPQAATSLAVTPVVASMTRPPTPRPAQPPTTVERNPDAFPMPFVGGKGSPGVQAAKAATAATIPTLEQALAVPTKPLPLQAPAQSKAAKLTPNIEQGQPQRPPALPSLSSVRALPNRRPTKTTTLTPTPAAPSHAASTTSDHATHGRNEFKHVS